jgi:hypothetical protein
VVAEVRALLCDLLRWAATHRCCRAMQVSPQNCLAGSYRVLTDAEDDIGTCLPCVKGAYCSGLRSLPQQCPAGTFNGLSSAPVNTSCVKCVAGHYCGLGTANAVPCPAGTWSAAEAATDVSGCRQCPAGSQCGTGSATPMPCPAGTFSSESMSQCIACPSGFYSNSSATKCSPCMPGRFCPAAGMSLQAMESTESTCGIGNYSASGQTACSLCPAGTFADMPGTLRCSDCPEGRYCPAGSAAPSDCLAGTFSSGVLPQCIACPSGLYSDSSATRCSPCMPGRFCPTNSTSRSAMESNTCAKGTFSASGQSECSVCPAGTFANTVATEDSCAECPAGSFCPASSSTPLHCPAGTKRNIVGGSQRQDCSDCEMGTFGGTEGSLSCSQCPEGMISSPGAKSASDCTFAVLVDPLLLIADDLSPERNFASHNVSLINTGVQPLKWTLKVPTTESGWIGAAWLNGVVDPGQRVYVPLDFKFDAALAYPRTNRTEFQSALTISAGQIFRIGVTMRTVSGIVDPSQCVVDGQQERSVAVGAPASWKLRTADRYGQRLRSSIGAGKVKVRTNCTGGSSPDWVDCLANSVCQGRLACSSCTDNLDGSYTFQVAPSTASECSVAVYVNNESLADRYPHLGVKAFATDVCSSFTLTANGAVLGRVTDANQSVIESDQIIRVQYPSDIADLVANLQVTLIPLKDSKQFHLSNDVLIDVSNLAVGKYMLELPAAGSLPRCFLSSFALQCAEGYETLNGEGLCYEVNKAKVMIAASLSALLVLFLTGVFIWVCKKRQSVKELSISVMKNEGMQGLALGNEVVDFAGDALVYHEVATRYRYMETLFIAYTVAFPLACLASVIAIGLKLRAMILQLRLRRRGLDLAVQASPDRRCVLQTRLDTCRKEQTQTYAAVLSATLEDLPMGVLSMVLNSSLPAGEKLSVINQLSIAWSWFNLGGKILKGTALLRLWAEEKEILRKLDKQPTAVHAQVPCNVAPDLGFAFDDRSTGSLRGQRLRRALGPFFPFGWVDGASARATQERGLELTVGAMIIPEQHGQQG